MREFNPNGPVDLASGLQQKVNQDLQSLRTYNQRANTVDAQAAQVAEQPMKLITAALDFSSTLKKRHDANKEEREAKQIAALEVESLNLNISTDGLDDWIKFKAETHKDQAKLDEYLKANYNEEQAKFLRSMGKGRLLIGSKLVAQNNANSLPLKFADFQRTPVTLSDGRVVTWAGTESADDQAEYYDAFKIKLVQDGKLDASSELYQETYKPAFDSLYRTAVSVKSQQKVTAYDKEYEAENQEFIFNAVNNVNGDVGVQDFMGLITQEMPNYGGNLGKTFDGVYEKYVMPMVQNNQVSRDQFYTFIMGVMDHKGMGKVSMEKGMGKKLHLHEINKQFSKNELQDLQNKQEIKKAKALSAEQVALDNLVPGLESGDYTIDDIIEAEGMLFQQFGYESSKLANLKKGYEMKSPEVATYDNAFKIAEGNGTLTVDMVEDTGNALLKKKWLAKARASEETRKGDQYKLQKKNVEGIVKAQFGKLLDSIQSPTAGEVQGHLNKYFEAKVNEYIAQYPENIDTAVNKAAIETQTYFKNNQGEGQDFYVDKMAYEAGGDVFPNWRKKQLANVAALDKAILDAQPKDANHFTTELVSTSIKIKNAGQDVQLALDTPLVFMNEAQVNDALSNIADGGMSDWLKVVSSQWNLDPFEVLEKQALALGFKKEDIPEKPEFLDVVDNTAAPDLVCLMRKVGVQNLPTATAKRLCLSMSPNGINDTELVNELYGDEDIVRNNSED